ncbi:MAG: hypothetical protein AAFN74_03355 [Myxococcota bacterium]
MASWLDKLLKRSGPRKSPRTDVNGFVVRAQPSGHVVHFDLEEVGHLDDQTVADRSVTHREKLERRYPSPRFEVEAGLFNSRDAFFHFFPELEGKPPGDIEETM